MEEDDQVMLPFPGLIKDVRWDIGDVEGIDGEYRAVDADQWTMQANLDPDSDIGEFSRKMTMCQVRFGRPVDTDKLGYSMEADIGKSINTAWLVGNAKSKGIDFYEAQRSPGIKGFLDAEYEYLSKLGVSPEVAVARSIARGIWDPRWYDFAVNAVVKEFGEGERCNAAAYTRAQSTHLSTMPTSDDTARTFHYQTVNWLNGLREKQEKDRKERRKKKTDEPGTPCEDPVEAIRDGLGGISNIPGGFPLLVRSDDCPGWGKMAILRPHLTRPHVGNRFRVKAKTAYTTGAYPRYMHRYCTDQAVFEAKRSKHGRLNILIDRSGSMNLTHEQVMGIVTAAPRCLVAYYSGDGQNNELVVIAKDGKAVDAKTMKSLPVHMGNEIDGPALDWLGATKGPKIWVSDMGVCVRDIMSSRLSRDAYFKVASYSVLVIETTNRCVRYLDAIATGVNPKEAMRAYGTSHTSVHNLLMR